MSTLKRFSLLVPYLDCLDKAWPDGDGCIDITDIYTVRQAFKAWITITSDILFNLEYSTPSVNTRISRLVRALVNAKQPSKWLIAAKKAYDLLIDFVSHRRSITRNLYVDFKDQLAIVLEDADLAGALVAPVNRILSSITDCGSTVNGCWVSSSTPLISDLAQYFGFLMKLELTRPDLESKALDDYLEFEANYPALDINGNTYALPLKRIIEKWFREFKYDGSDCRHGNGSVANATRAKLDKYLSMHIDDKLNYLYNRNKAYNLYERLPFPPKEDLDRCSKLQFVPKNISKLRSISMEPAALQFVQQGVMTSLYRFIKHHRVMKRHINLSDQTQNKSFAYDGSITDRYSTIDLSAASDSVSYDLVHYLFSGLPEVWRWIICTRSDRTLLPDGSKLYLKKFAPMGSAICFPLETVIFAAIAELATLIGHERGLTQDVRTGVYNDYYTVYGDDIIVPRGVYQLTADILTSFGFSMNMDKSYDHSPFKESCGGNYFCGTDITAIKWKINLTKSGKLDAENYGAICTVVNALFDKGYKVTRCYLIRLLKEQGYQPLFTSERGKSPAIYSPTPTNFHLKKKWRSGLQCFELEYSTLKTTPLNPQLQKANIASIDAILYKDWLASKQKDSRGTRVILSVNGKVTGRTYIEVHHPLFKLNEVGGYDLNVCSSPTRNSLVLTKVVKAKGRFLCYE